MKADEEQAYLADPFKELTRGTNLLSAGDASTNNAANGLPLYPQGAIGVGVIRPRVLGLSLTAGL